MPPLTPVQRLFVNHTIATVAAAVANASTTLAPVDSFDAGFPGLKGKTTNERLAELGLSIPLASAPMTGEAFGASIMDDTKDEREEKTERALLAGHIPPALREFHPVRLTAKVDGVETKAVVWVMPDYVSVGDQNDSLRIPMYSATAQRVADKFGARFPTSKVVDAVERAAPVKIAFQKREAGARMESTAEFIAHDKVIDDALAGRTGLIANHKKDTVISNRRREVRNGRSQINEVAIYGGRHPTGGRAQNLATPHFHRHSDYSQGIRFVAPRVLVQRGTGGWEWKSYDEILKDPKWAVLLSDEGPISPPFNRYPTDPWAGSVKPPSR